MYDGPEKGKIDIDELLDSLLKNRDETAAAEPAQQPVEEPIPVVVEEPVPVVEIVPAPIVVEEPTPVVEEESAPIVAEKPAPVVEEEPAPIVVEEPTPVVEEEPAPIVVEEPVIEFVSLNEEDDELGAPVVLPVQTSDLIFGDDDSDLEPVATASVGVDQGESARPAKKKRGLFGLFSRKEEVAEEDDEETWNDWGLKPIGHYQAETVAPAAPAVVPEPVAEEPAPVVEEAPAPAVEEEPAPVVEEEPAPVVEEAPVSTAAPVAVDEFPAVRAVAETITMPVILPSGMAATPADDKTRVIPHTSEEEPSAPAEPPVFVDKTGEEQLPDQLSLEEMVRVEDIESADGIEDINPDEAPEVRLQRNREEKVREFTLEGDEEEVNDPEEEAPADEQEPEVKKSVKFQDARAVISKLKRRRSLALFTLMITGMMEFVLLLLTFLATLFAGSTVGVIGYLVMQLFMLALMMGINYRAMGRGFLGLFTFKPNSDSSTVLAALVSVFELLLHFAPGDDRALPFTAPLAGLLLLFSAYAYFVQSVSIRRNFSFISYPGEKYAATLIEEENAVQEIGRRAAGNGEALVGYFHRTDSLTDYLDSAYAPHQGDDWSRFVTPVAFGLSLVISPFALLTGGGFWGWLATFATMVCLTMPAFQLAVQLPLSKCGRAALSRGGFLAGWEAVRQFGKLDALVVDIADLYPDESMLLHGIKTFSGTHIDEAILTAAALAVRSGGPLSMIFRRIIENKDNLLSEVENLVYEQGMGLSGWVDGRRVFVGNRRLLENHGIDVPSSDYEARYAKDGRRLVYLSIGGQLSAMFVVSYLPNREIRNALQDLCRSHVTLLVRSCDPNITTADLCESFRLNEYYVDVMPAAAGRTYMKLVEQPLESAPAVMASNGHILGTARTLSVCRSLQTKCILAMIAQIVIASIGLLFCLMLSLSGMLAVIFPLLLMLASAFMTWLVPMFRRT